MLFDRVTIATGPMKLFIHKKFKEKTTYIHYFEWNKIFSFFYSLSGVWWSLKQVCTFLHWSKDGPKVQIRTGWRCYRWILSVNFRHYLLTLDV